MTSAWLVACSSESSNGSNGGSGNASGGATSSNGGTASSNGGATASNGGATGSSGSSSTGSVVYSPCADDKRVGTLAISFVPPTEASGDTPAVAGHSDFNGSVNDKVSPSDVWVQKSKEGDCRLMVGPKLTCSPTCDVGQVCLGNNSCTTAPAGQNVGGITVAGFASPLSVTYLSGSSTYYAGISGAFPPVAAGTALTLTAAGATYPGFTVKANAIDPMIVGSAAIALDPTKPLTITWTKPTVLAGRVELSLDLAHHGNVAAKLKCDVEDTGTFTIPSSSLTTLAAEGVAGFPSVSITRRSVASVSVQSGCVDFTVASSVNRELTVAGLTSCQCPGSTCSDCPTGKTCGLDYVCK
ncbi:MAG: hypothetical protein QM756_21705 [Polyangiaceae bacterium]